MQYERKTSQKAKRFFVFCCKQVAVQSNSQEDTDKNIKQKQKNQCFIFAFQKTNKK